MAADPLTTAVFDLGGVVLGWAPERAFGQVLAASQVPDFMARIDFFKWNRRHDGGLLFDAGEQELIERFPDDAEAVRAYRRHFGHTLTGLVEGTGAVVAELQQAGIRLLALTNWSAETFPVAVDRFRLLQRFEDILVSGEVGLAKPDSAIFELVSARYQVPPEECVFIDDVRANVDSAIRVGFTGLHFTGADRLRCDLERLGLLRPRQPIGHPILHLTERSVWRAAEEGGGYGWSTRGISYLQQGYVHCSFEHQLAGVAEAVYPDLSPADLVIVELDPDAITPPVVVEDLDGGGRFPHIYGELPIDQVSVMRNCSG